MSVDGSQRAEATTGQPPSIEQAVGSTELTPPFERCPRCRYSFTGLPPRGACPECGLRYDEDSRAYCMRKRRWPVVLVPGVGVVGSLFSLLVVLLSAWNLTQGVLERACAGVFGGVIVIAWFVGLARTINGYRSDPCVAVATDGLILNLPTYSLGLVPWSRIGGMRACRHLGIGCPLVRVKLANPWAMVYLGHAPLRMFRKREEAEAFIEHIQARMAQAREQAEP
jgi:hypothetical protein